MTQDSKKFVFNIYVFFMAFAIGMLYVYISTPKPKIIIKYPTPYNAEKVVYKSYNDNCYKFKVSEVKCTNDAIPQPIV